MGKDKSEPVRVDCEWCDGRGEVDNVGVIPPGSPRTSRCSKCNGRGWKLQR